VQGTHLNDGCGVITALLRTWVMNMYRIATM
jgi:hypothetical protein